MKFNYVLLSMDEAWLKGGNRFLYTKALKKHILLVAKKFGYKIINFRNFHHRFILILDREISLECQKALSYIPGIGVVMPTCFLPNEFDKIESFILEELKTFKSLPSTFKLETKRRFSDFPMNSMEMDAQLGASVLSQFPELKVCLKNPQLTIYVEILELGAFVAFKRIKGIGGLPVGSSGRCLTLLSGGFDSAVASFLAAKRGCAQEFVFFHVYPFVGEEVKEKVASLFEVLKTFQIESKLHIVSFGEVQQEIAKVCSKNYRTLFFRKAMIDAANMLASKNNLQGLITGDSLSQVSSQTLENLEIIDRNSPRIILRPLIGMNKQEILSLARQIGTHDISEIPHQDACSLLAARHPILRPDIKYWENFTEQHSFENLIKKVISETQTYNSKKLFQDLPPLSL